MGNTFKRRIRRAIASGDMDPELVYGKDYDKEAVRKARKKWLKKKFGKSPMRHLVDRR